MILSMYGFHVSVWSMVVVLTFFGVALFSIPAWAGEYRVVKAIEIAEEPACMPSATRAANGDIVVSYGTEWEPFPWGGYQKFTISKDQGKTWSKPKTLWQDPDPRVTIQTGNGMQRLSNGDILMPAKRWIYPKRAKHNPKETSPAKIYDVGKPYAGYWSPQRVPALYQARSSDNGQTWTIEDTGLRASRFGRLIETRDGRLNMVMGCYRLASRDFGKTWAELLPMGTPTQSETNFVETANGTVFYIQRQGGQLGERRVFTTGFSKDGGWSWSPWRWIKPKIKGKMPDLMVLPSRRILMAVGFEGVSDGSELYRKKDRTSFVTLFYSDDHGQTWNRDLAMKQVVPGSSITPCDSPLLVSLDNDRILVIMQAQDRSETGPLAGYSAGLSLVGNIIEAVK